MPARRFWRDYWKEKIESSKSSSLDSERYPQLHQFVSDWISKHISEKAKGKLRILEIGIGPGGLAKKIKQLFNNQIELHGVDIHIPVKHEGIIYHEVPAEKLPFNDNEFDAVYSVFTLAYTDEEKALSELRRVLKDDGRAILVVHSPSSTVKYLLEDAHQKATLGLSFRKRDVKEGKKQLKDISNIERDVDEYAYLLERITRMPSNANALKEFFESHGFSVEEIREIKAGNEPFGGQLGFGVVLKKSERKGKPIKLGKGKKYEKSHEVKPMPPDIDEGMVWSMAD